MICGNDAEYDKAVEQAEKDGYYMLPSSFFGGSNIYPILVCPRCGYKTIHRKDNIRNHIAKHYPMLFERGDKSVNKLNGDNFRAVNATRLPIPLTCAIDICLFNLEPREEPKKPEPEPVYKPNTFDPLSKKRNRK